MSNQESILDFILKDEDNVTEKQKQIIAAAIEAFSEKGLWNHW